MGSDMAMMKLPIEPDVLAELCRVRMYRAELFAVMSSTPIPGSVNDSTIVVNSAGCGALMKEYGRLLGDVRAERFSELGGDQANEVVAEAAGRIWHDDRDRCRAGKLCRRGRG